MHLLTKATAARTSLQVHSKASPCFCLRMDGTVLSAPPLLRNTLPPPRVLWTLPPHSCSVSSTLSRRELFSTKGHWIPSVGRQQGVLIWRETENTPFALKIKNMEYDTIKNRTLRATNNSVFSTFADVG